MTSGLLCFNELTFGSLFEFVGFTAVLVSSENNGFKGFVMLPFVFLPASGVWSNPAGSRHVTT